MPSSSPVIVFAYPGVLQSAVLGLSDILGHAGVAPVIVEEPNPVLDGARAILLPPAATRPDVNDVPEAAGWLADQASHGALICSVCVGVAWVAAAGLDRGRPVTTHWGAEPLMRKEWPELLLDTDRLVIEYADLVTAGGMMAWIDLALIVIERLAGQQIMLETARHFVVDPPRRDQRRFQRFHPETQHGDQAVRRAQLRIETDMHNRLSVNALAATARLTPRNLQRRFVSATGLTLTQYMQKLRVERAKTMLADSSASIAEISEQIGYTDVPAFYRVFQKVTGATPAVFRKSVRLP